MQQNSLRKGKITSKDQEGLTRLALGKPLLILMLQLFWLLILLQRMKV